MGLDPVVEPAEAGEVVGARLARWSTGVGWEVFLDVVEVEPAGAPAPGEDTPGVAFGDLGAEPVRGLVGVDRDVLVELDDRGEGDGGAGCEVGEPLPDRVDRPGAEPLD